MASSLLLPSLSCPPHPISSQDVWIHSFQKYLVNNYYVPRAQEVNKIESYACDTFSLIILPLISHISHPLPWPPFRLIFTLIFAFVAPSLQCILSHSTHCWQIIILQSSPQIRSLLEAFAWSSGLEFQTIQYFPYEITRQIPSLVLWAPIVLPVPTCSNIFPTALLHSAQDRIPQRVTLSKNVIRITSWTG